MTSLSDLSTTLIRKISASEFSDRQLTALLKNAEANGDLQDIDRERLIAAIELQLRVDHPRVARKFFGPKDIEARKALNKIWLQTVDKFDVSRNVHNNGVKTGGAMMKGEKHVDVYISYRNKLAQAVHLSLVQPSPSEDFTASLAKYVVGGNLEFVFESPGTGLLELGPRFMEIVSELVRADLTTS